MSVKTTTSTSIAVVALCRASFSGARQWVIRLALALEWFEHCGRVHVFLVQLRLLLAHVAVAWSSRGGRWRGQVPATWILLALTERRIPIDMFCKLVLHSYIWLDDTCNNNTS